MNIDPDKPSKPSAADFPYIGRFAPSPSGALHAGSLVAALASYLDARAHGGLWLVRMEDIDEARSVPGAADAILDALHQLGMQHDQPVQIQSQRKPVYQAAAARLGSLLYPCACTRKEIAAQCLGMAADGAAIYAGTCRYGMVTGKQARTLRLRVPDADTPDATITFHDRFLGLQTQNLAKEVGDFVIKRADGFWAYQLAVVVDDASQHITHVVRGADLLDSTQRQIYLQRLLHYSTPSYLHVPLVRNKRGEKLSKQNGAQPLDLTRPLEELLRAARFLGLPVDDTHSLPAFWQSSIHHWKKRYRMGNI